MKQMNGNYAAVSIQNDVPAVYKALAITAAAALALNSARADGTNGVGKARVNLDEDGKYTLNVAYGQSFGGITDNDKVTFPDNSSPDQTLGGNGSDVSVFDVILEREFAGNWRLRLGLEAGAGSTDFTVPSAGTPGMEGTADFEEDVSVILGKVGLGYDMRTKGGRLGLGLAADLFAGQYTSDLTGVGSVTSGRYSGAGRSMESDASEVVYGIKLGVVGKWSPVEWADIYAGVSGGIPFNGDYEADALTDVTLQMGNRTVQGQGHGERSGSFKPALEARVGIAIPFGKRSVRKHGRR